MLPKLNLIREIVHDVLHVEPGDYIPSFPRTEHQEMLPLRLKAMKAMGIINTFSFPHSSSMSWRRDL